jgi:hypothetical protein
MRSLSADVHLSRSRRIAGALAVLAAFCAIAPHTARAQGYTEIVCGQGQGGITLSVDGAFIVLRGGICPKDDGKFVAFIKKLDPAIRTLRLISGGGNGEAAQAIGETIRKKGFDTYVDGSVDRCASACTHIFAAGVHRFYAGATDIVTGKTARRGLGYHYLDANHAGESDGEKNRKFNATAVPYLTHMLPPAAAQAAIALMEANRTPQVTWLNGDEALRSGIATSLNRPQ